MAEISEKIINIIKDCIRDVQYYFPINRAVLYGSYAKGTYTDNSDIDVAFFFDIFKEMKRIEVKAFLFSLARKYKDICIETIVFDNSDLGKGHPFIKEIMDTGKEIYI
ncbi:MAG TPA: nucleotidyltransferase domain-containing protein [Clostridiales bacterium]|nr:nucleotidyltransferase domain-containing protein [Clostridiales bacterium]